MIVLLIIFSFGAGFISHDALTQDKCQARQSHKQELKDKHFKGE